MPYLIFSANGDEIDRRELSEPVIIGRAPDCSICIRDILLSRKHCALELQNDAWLVTDLGSRNGTFLAEERVERHILRDGDSLRMGRTWMIFRAGKFAPGKRPDADKPKSRPVDPNEAMAGTVVGFELLDPGDAEYDEAMPVPKPRPREPRSYERDVAGMVNEISSNEWDSAHNDESSQVRVRKSAAQKVAPAAGPRQVVRPKSRVSFDLQADEKKVVPKEKVATTQSNDSGSNGSGSNGKWTI
jgi:predicted component of type VI protein secretion system